MTTLASVYVRLAASSERAEHSLAHACYQWVSALNSQSATQGSILHILYIHILVQIIIFNENFYKYAM